VEPLSQLELLVLDCQATRAAPLGRLLELGWARVGARPSPPTARLIRLPQGERVPPAVERITGIDAALLAKGVEPADAFRELRAAAEALGEPARAVAHFARFERPFLERAEWGPPQLDLVCTQQIALRLLPELPRRSLRALAGYFGCAVGALRRSAEHVAATAVVWRELAALLEARGVCTWPELRAFLLQPLPAGPRPRKRSPLPRELRLSLPDRPGVYRLLRQGGSVLYVGKATSLRARVNGHFRKQRGLPERTLEMLSQARALSVEVTESALEAALLEPDEIKRHRPPYNRALVERSEGLWFASRDLARRSPRATPECAVGPFGSAELIDRVAALSRGERAALGWGRFAPTPEVFLEGLALLRAAHPELRRRDAPPHARLRWLGRRLFREGLRPGMDDEGDDAAPEQWTPALARRELELLCVRAALALRRACWLTLLMDSTLIWNERSATGPRLVQLSSGEVVLRGAAAAPTPLAATGGASLRQRAARFTLARLDRLRVLTTELKRLAQEQAEATLWLGARAPLQGERLARALQGV
jgi:DNA polymerase-3 subunit epsilon